MTTLDADHVSHVAAAGLVGVYASAGLGWITPAVAAIASLLAIVWYAIQIWESQPAKRWRLRAGWRVPARVSDAGAEP